MRFVHIFAAIGIALLANSIEPVWLGLLALMAMLGIYAYIAVAIHKRGSRKDPSKK